MTAIYRPSWILLFCFVLSGCFVMLWEQCVLLFDCVLCWINQFLVISAPPVLPGEHSEIAERGPCRRNCCSSRRWTDYITASFFFPLEYEKLLSFYPGIWCRTWWDPSWMNPWMDFHGTSSVFAPPQELPVAGPTPGSLFRRGSSQTNLRWD